MLKLAKLFILILLGLGTKAQTHYFVYIEQPNKQPFTVQLDGKTFEASTKNFVIIPKLEKGTYNLGISTLTATNIKFTIDINESDLGFALKQNTDNEMVLFNLNKFTTLLQDGKIVETIKEETVIKKEPVITQKNEENANPINVASTTNKTKENVVEKETKRPVNKKIKKIYQKKNKEGIDEVYVDTNETKNDTISIFIPYKTVVDTPKQIVQTPLKEEHIEPVKKDTVAIVIPNCKKPVSEREIGDFSAKIQETLMLKHKLKLAAAVVKDKCFTVSQIKRLGVLFLNETGKLYFYKLAINAVTDIENFSLLEKELKDAKIIEEFRALLK